MWFSLRSSPPCHGPSPAISLGIMRNRIIMVIAALITALVVFNLIQLTIGIYNGDIPVRGASLGTVATTPS